MTNPIRVLFVDNQVEQREWLAEKLRRNYRFEVFCADDGAAALAHVKAAQTAYDVALVDVRLGTGPDGIEVMKSLQAIHPGVEVIIITGFGDVDDGLRAMQAGACNYVFKPWRDEELVVYIRAAAERRRLRNVERELDGLQKVLSVSEAMTQSLDPEEIAREICMRTVPLIPALKLFYIAAYDEIRDEVKFLWAVGAEKRDELLLRSLAEQKNWGLVGQVIKTKQAIIAADLDTDEN
jgi:response regulator RpfG family c-di-GMP phosphodiesterase